MQLLKYKKIKNFKKKFQKKQKVKHEKKFLIFWPFFFSLKLQLF
jgi:hypothetical protein